MKTNNIILYIIICLIIIAGIAVWNSKGFNSELQYSSRNQINLANNKGIEVSDVEAMAKEVLGNKRVMVQKVETFGNAITIVADEITEEDKEKIIEKFNEKYETKISKDDVEIQSIPFTRVKDVIRPYIIPGICTLVLVTIYFLIRFGKMGWKQILSKSILAPVVAELLIFSLMAIIRIPFGRLAIALGVGIYVAIIYALTATFEEQKERYIEDLGSE